MPAVCGFSGRALQPSSWHVAETMFLDGSPPPPGDRSMTACRRCAMFHAGPGSAEGDAGLSDRAGRRDCGPADRSRGRVSRRPVRHQQRNGDRRRSLAAGRCAAVRRSARRPATNRWSRLGVIGRLLRQADRGSWAEAPIEAPASSSNFSDLELSNIDAEIEPAPELRVSATAATARACGCGACCRRRQRSWSKARALIVVPKMATPP